MGSSSWGLSRSSRRGITPDRYLQFGDAALDFLKGLKGQDLEVSLSSLGISCDALRAGEQTIAITVDPERSAALVAKAKSSPGVVAALLEGPRLLQRLVAAP